jgi:hypothetical protein
MDLAVDRECKGVREFLKTAMRGRRERTPDHPARLDASVTAASPLPLSRHRQLARPFSVKLSRSILQILAILIRIDTYDAA